MSSWTIRTITEGEGHDEESAAIRAIIREDVLGELSLTVVEVPARFGVSRVTLSRVIHGHASVSPNLAVRLERAGVGTARAWLALQTNYDLARELDGKSHDVRPLVVA